MAMKKKCSYCDAMTNSRISLVDQGWTSVQLWVETDGEGTKMFSGRACPQHRKQLNEDAIGFYNSGGKLGGR